eukprot:Skav210298  [mRNA]  locus=scaffold475:131404:135774:- [translate_table: standard]
MFRNRSRIVISILDELWLHALPWEGVYADDESAENSLQVTDHGMVKAETPTAMGEDVLGNVSKGHLEPQLNAGGVTQLARQDLYRQREVWRQHMVLYTEQKRSGGGAAVKTNFLREVLKRLSEEPADEVPKEDSTAGDEALLVSLPVDPTALFCGTVVEESEVLPSKQAPVMLVCHWADLVSAGGRSSTEASRPRYLLKVGDDLRQDQLMLEMLVEIDERSAELQKGVLMSLMGRVWQAHLLPEDVT